MTEGGGGGTFTKEQEEFILRHVRALALAHTEDGRRRGTMGVREREERARGLDEAERLDLRGRRCGGVFVTYEGRGGERLRGCIGQFFPDDELVLVVQSRTVAALHDDRFADTPITAAELAAPGRIQISVSVLSEPVDVPDDVRGDALVARVTPGVHGIIVREKRGYRGGTYLPQVCTEQGWSARKFLTHCALCKAGIPTRDPLTDKRLAWQTYTATVLCDGNKEDEDEK